MQICTLNLQEMDQCAQLLKPIPQQNLSLQHSTELALGNVSFVVKLATRKKHNALLLRSGNSRQCQMT